MQYTIQSAAGQSKTSYALSVCVDNLANSKRKHRTFDSVRQRQDRDNSINGAGLIINQTTVYCPARITAIQIASERTELGHCFNTACSPATFHSTGLKICLHAQLLQDLYVFLVLHDTPNISKCHFISNASSFFPSFSLQFNAPTVIALFKRFVQNYIRSNLDT